MSTTTTNLGMTLLAEEDNFDTNVYNENFQKTDNKIGELNNKSFSFKRNLKENEDVDNVLDIGIYSATTNIAITLVNTYYTNAFIMFVYSSGSYIIQEQIRVGVGGYRAYRVYSGGEFVSDWNEECTIAKLETSLKEKSNILHVMTIDSESISIESGNVATSQNFSVELNGYTPIGIIGYRAYNSLDGGIASSHIVFSSIYLNGTNVIFNAKNLYTDTAKFNLRTTILYVKNT